jgi:hypothetical protein
MAGASALAAGSILPAWPAPIAPTLGEWVEDDLGLPCYRYTGPLRFPDSSEIKVTPLQPERKLPMRLVSVRSCLAFSALFTMAAGAATSATNGDFLKQYKGAPFEDSRFHGVQKIPGEVRCAYYDRGGEGVAFHDSDAKNNGSGALNPANGSYLNEFRMAEGVDTSYTKMKLDPQIDDNPYEKIQPPANLLYVGWTEPGEWFNVTVSVAQAGDYSADLLYTSNRGGTISLDVNGEAVTGPLTINSTFNAADPVAWRQWHHWNIAPGIAKVHLGVGRSVVTVHILTEGQMNLAYFDFKPTD